MADPKEHIMNLAFKTIVLATDFSEQSQLALEYARIFVKRFDANLRVLHVVEIPAVFGVDVPSPDIAGLAEQAIETAQEALSRTLAPLTETNVIGQVLVGDPAARIVQYANDHAADLIVMGTHGRGGVAHFFMGSVAERVMRAAPCPVFTVRDVEALQCAFREVAIAAAS
jgi:nucleotide-binding universal stress UspA family protein